MKLQLKNIELEEGIDKRVLFECRDETTNLPIDISAHTAILQVCSAFGNPQVILELTSDLEKKQIIMIGSIGIVEVIFDSTYSDLDTQSVPWNGLDSAVYDLILTSPYGQRTKLAKGFITISRSSTIV